MDGRFWCPPEAHDSCPRCKPYNGNQGRLHKQTPQEPTQRSSILTFGESPTPTPYDGNQGRLHKQTPQEQTQRSRILTFGTFPM